MGQSEQSNHDAAGHGETLRGHLLQLDHWTFLLALALVLANVWVGSPYLSAVAAALLLVALCYDAYEFYRS
jgi:hypothetical protein